MNKPYKCLQSHGQGHIKKGPTVVASLMVIACLVAENMQRWFFAFADPLWPCIKVKVIKTGYPQVYRHVKFECNSLQIVWDIAS